LLDGFGRFAHSSDGLVDAVLIIADRGLDVVDGTDDSASSITGPIVMNHLKKLRVYMLSNVYDSENYIDLRTEPVVQVATVTQRFAKGAPGAVDPPITQNNRIRLGAGLDVFVDVYGRVNCGLGPTVAVRRRWIGAV
jgi:hypothetical protein